MFSILKQLKNPNSSWYDRIEAKFKLSLYSIMHAMLQSQLTSPYLYYILVIVEAGQFLWFAIHPDYPFLWTGTLSNYPRDVIKYMQVDFLLREQGESFFYAFLYSGLGLQIIVLISIIIILVKLKQSKKRGSTLAFYLLQFLSLYAILLKTMATIPLFQIFFAAVICHQNDIFTNTPNCYQGIGLVNTIVGVFGIAMLFFFTFFTHLLFIDPNPSSNIPFAAPLSNMDIYKLALKTLVPLYVVIDQNFDNIKTFLILYLIAWIAALVLRYRSDCFYHKPATIIVTLTEALVVWGILIANIHAQIVSGAEDDTGIYFFLFGAPFVMYAYYMLIEYRRWQTVCKDVKTSKYDVDIERYINVACALVEKKDNRYDRIELEGLFRYHAVWCGMTDCSCHAQVYTVPREEENAETKTQFFSFIGTTLEGGLMFFPKSPRLHLLNAYFQQEKKKNRFKALYELMVTEENHPGLREEFSVFRYRNIIEKEMEEDEIRNTNNKDLDVKLLVQFQEQYVTLQTEISKAVLQQLEFWRELDQTNPNVQKLLFLGSKITLQAETVKSEYSKLHEINSNNLKMLNMYGNFLKDIMNDTFESQRIIEKASYIAGTINMDKKYADSERFKYSENSNTCIITCSGNIHDVGIILNANTEVTRILKYQVNDLLGENISMLMPQILADIHDDLMKNYFETSKPSSMDSEMLVFPMMKSGYILPCSLLIKIFPNLEEGIKVVGFLNSIETESHSSSSPPVSNMPSKASEEGLTSGKVHYIVYGGESNTIYGVSESCKKTFGISSGLTLATNRNFNEFTIDKIFPDILKQNPEELASQTGLLLTLDTTFLHQDFFVEKRDSQSDEEEDDEETMERRYRRAKVRAMVIQDRTHLGKVTIKVLKFVEASDEKLFKKAVTIISPDLKKGRAVDRADSIEILREETLSEAASNTSVGSVAIDDIRQLKDMKAQISEKKVPSSISALQKIAIFLITSLIILTSIQLHEKGTIKNQLYYGVNSTLTTYLRDDVLAQINFKVRELELLANGMLDYTGTLADYEASLKQEINTLMTELNEILFGISEGRQIIAGIDENIIVPNQLNIKSMLKDSTTISLDLAFTQAFFDFVFNTRLLIEADLTEFNNIPNILYFYFLKTNGLQGLREGAQSVNEVFKSFYKKRADTFSRFFLITMLIGILLVSKSLVLIVPKILVVTRINMKVLSLFGYIPLTEVAELANQCERYLNIYLDDFTAKKVYQQQLTIEELPSPTITAGLNISVNAPTHNRAGYMGLSHRELPISPVPIMNSPTSPDDEAIMTLPDQDENPRSVAQLLLNENRPTEVQTLVTREDQNGFPNRRRGTEQKESKEEDDEEQLEYLYARSKRLRDTKSNNKKVIVFQVGIFAMIFVIYFVVDFILDNKYMKKFQLGMDHLSVIVQRVPNLRYNLAFALEELAENDLSVVYPDISASERMTNNYRIQYEQNMSLIQMQIKNAANQHFPGAFDNYLSLLLNYDQGNVCQLYYQPNTALVTECENVGIGNIMGGLILAEVGLVGYADSVMTQFYAQMTRTTQVQKDAINSATYQTAVKILDQIAPAMDYLRGVYVETFYDYLLDQWTLQRVRFAIFLIALIFLTIFVWMPYLRKLTRQIFRTKGLLNMIPMTMLQKNKNLRDIFTSQEILNAIK